EPEVPQNPVNDIRMVERLAVHFDSRDQTAPWVYALRKDFPQVVHQNVMPFDLPRCLCLFQTGYEEIKLTWTGVSFLERIRQWLSLTAEGKLHQDDQPLEPFIIASGGSLVIPESLGKNKALFLYELQAQPRSLIGLNRREPQL